jgi:hypothetical protein
MKHDLTTVSPRQGFRVLQFIWAMMVVSLGIMALVAYFIPAGGMGNVSSGTAAMVGGVVAGILFTVQLKLRQNLSDKNLFPRILDLDSWGLGEDTSARLKEMQVPERGGQLILQAHLVFGIITWAMAEMVGALGLALTFMSGQQSFMGVFGAIALAEFVLFRPAGGAFEKQLEGWGKYVEKNRNQESEVAKSSFLSA